MIVDPQPDNAEAADHAPADVGDAIDEAPDEFNPLAIVPYQQPIFQPINLMIGAVRVAYGPPLAPVVSWTRSFEALVGVFSSPHVPRHLQMLAATPIVLPKRSWSNAFDEDRGEPNIVYRDCTPTAPSFELFEQWLC
ncbi:hypothetical protein D1007_43983 [Hordeum vulgare]|nr:hypothetical protein D1007_43983 [Hordeum vulgare]